MSARIEIEVRYIKDNGSMTSYTCLAENCVLDISRRVDEVEVEEAGAPNPSEVFVTVRASDDVSWLLAAHGKDMPTRSDA